MNREEAMFEIGRYYAEGIRPSEESIKHIIHVLQNTDDDCISRQAVLSEIETVCFSEEWIKFRLDNGSNGERDYIINYIKELPSVQPEPFINKPCISEVVCHEDKIKVLDKLRAELHATAEMHEDGDYYLRDEWIDEYFDAYKADREKAENTTWEEPSYTDALNVLTEVRDKIRELPVITEQDIVKPVLDKIRAEIEHLTITEGGEDYTRKMAELYSLKIKVLQIIGKYMAESEE